MAAKEEVPAQTVREIHEHEDGTLIGPAQQSPDPEEIEEQRRPPSLGEILLREAEALRAEREAERQAAAKAEQSASLTLPTIQAVAEKRVPHPVSSCSSRRLGGLVSPREARTLSLLQLVHRLKVWEWTTPVVSESGE